MVADHYWYFFTIEAPHCICTATSDKLVGFLADVIDKELTQLRRFSRHDSVLGCGIGILRPATIETDQLSLESFVDVCACLGF